MTRAPGLGAVIRRGVDSRWSGHGSGLRRAGTGLAVGAAAIAVVSGVVALLGLLVSASALGSLYLFAIFPVAVGWGFWVAGIVAVASFVTFDFFFVPPLYTLGISRTETATAVVVSILAAYLVSELARQVHERVLEERLRDHDAALRRIATLVAEAATAETVFTRVAEEVAAVAGIAAASVQRFEPGGEATVVGRSGRLAGAYPVGRRVDLDGNSVTALVHRTQRPARVDSYDRVSGTMAEELQELGVRSAVATPIVVNGRLWGAIAAASSAPQPIPQGIEAHIAEFTELVATAIANVDARAELAASRARIVVAGDEVRRRIERNLHDGVQQRLVSLALHLRRIERHVPADPGELRSALAEAVVELNATNDEVREIAQGIHPAILNQGGLARALRALAGRCTMAVEVVVRCEDRLPEPLEAAAYYVVAEALTNATKHGEASRASVNVERHDGVVRLRVSDDGVGGADPSAGSGLTGIRDRVEALGGSLEVASPRGKGTVLDVTLPATVGAEVQQR